MIKGSLSVLTIALGTALFIVNGLKSIEAIDFNLPDRATRLAVANEKLLNSSIETTDSTSGLASALNRNARIVQHRQQLLLLEQEFSH